VFGQVACHLEWRNFAFAMQANVLCVKCKACNCFRVTAVESIASKRVINCCEVCADLVSNSLGCFGNDKRKATRSFGNSVDCASRLRVTPTHLFRMKACGNASGVF
jgi:hypothetical protein